MRSGLKRIGALPAADTFTGYLMAYFTAGLVNWSAPRLLNVAGAIPAAGSAWAPEAIFDPAT